MNLLTVENISKSFGGVHALKNVQLEIFSGEVHALLGENGAGKSTLIKVITGVHQPDEGEIELNGTAVYFNNPREAQQQGIAAIIYTDIDRDGILKGLNLPATRAMAEATSIPVIASGGLASIDDIRASASWYDAEGVRSASMRNGIPGCARHASRAPTARARVPAPAARRMRCVAILLFPFLPQSFSRLSRSRKAGRHQLLLPEITGAARICREQRYEDRDFRSRWNTCGHE